MPPSFERCCCNTSTIVTVAAWTIRRAFRLFVLAGYLSRSNTAQRKEAQGACCANLFELYAIQRRDVLPAATFAMLKVY